MVAYASANGGIDRGTKFILTVVDYFSRKVWLRPLKSQSQMLEMSYQYCSRN
jgi:hypothetical protein